MTLESSILIHFISVVLIITLPVLGVAIGGSIAAISAKKASYIQPKAQPDILKITILGLALTETAAIIALVVTLLIITGKNEIIITNMYHNLSTIGIAFAISIPGFLIGILSALPIKYSCFSVARQPFLTNKIMNIMLLTMSLLQTPIVFGFIISRFIGVQAPTTTSIFESIKFISSGLCIGIGSIGPLIGLAIFSKAACQSLGINREIYNKIVTFTFISEALIETPIIFALVTSLLLITSTPQNLLYSIILFTAGLSTAIGNFMPGISSGRTAAEGCFQIAKNANAYSLISRTSILAQGLIDSITIYAWIISLVLIFFIK